MRMRLSFIGFTLIEMLTVLSLVLILLMFAGPFSQAMIRRNELALIEHDIRSALYLSRNEAQTDAHVYILQSLSNTSDWSEGFMVYRVNVGQKREKVYEQRWSLHHWQVFWQGFQGKKQIILSSSPYHRGMNGHFLIASSHHADKHLLKVNREGRIT